MMIPVGDGLSDLIAASIPTAWLEHAYMRRALLAALFIAPAAAAMGVHVVTFRMAFFSDAISHSAFTGVALGLLLGIDPRITLVGFGLLIAVLITQVRRRSELPTDTVIGVFFAAVVALGITLISTRPGGLARTLPQFLYGDILFVTGPQLWLMLALLLLVAIFLLVGHNSLTLVGINPALAATRGVPLRTYEYLFALLVALVVCVSIGSIGLLLVTAMLILPAATARNVARSGAQMFWLAIVFGLLAAVAGLILSFYWGTKTGATIILINAVLFAATWCISLAKARRIKGHTTRG